MRTHFADCVEIRASQISSSLSAIILLSFSLLDLSSFSACRNFPSLNFCGGEVADAAMDAAGGFGDFANGDFSYEGEDASVCFIIDQEKERAFAVQNCLRASRNVP
eukprot:1161632-Pelagomonas_calceolata.AAC.8